MNEIARIARDWATFAGILAIGGIVMLITWLSTLPSPTPPCIARQVTLNCPFNSPVMNSRYQDAPVVQLINGSPEWGTRP